MAKRVKQKAASRYWVAGENGYEKNSSAEIIRKTLSITKKKRKFVVILHKGYQSGSTVIVEIGRDFLTIDKPLDWPGFDKVRVVFKDESQVWNYFSVRVLDDKEDTVKTEFPTELFRLQRRAHFRVNLPNGSHVSFLKGEEFFEDVPIGNISIGGMMFCLAAGLPVGELQDGDEIARIEITIPKEAPGNATPALTAEELFETLAIGRGTIVRSFVDANDQVTQCMGVQFALRAGEEERLQQVVRKRELAMLRKGVLGT